MEAEEFKKRILSENKGDYEPCPPPINAQKGLNILIKHFLGDDWYTTMPISTEQANAEAIYEILRDYPRKKTLKFRLKNMLTARRGR